MDDVVQRQIAQEVRARLNEFTSAEKRVAQTLLSNYPVAGLETVNSFAHRAQVSTATVLRFVNKLGFAIYSEFQAVLFKSPVKS